MEPEERLTPSTRVFNTIRVQEKDLTNIADKIYRLMDKLSMSTINSCSKSVELECTKPYANIFDRLNNDLDDNGEIIGRINNLLNIMEDNV